MLWKNLFGLLWDHFGECAVEELLWASQGSLWWVCCGRATTLGPLGYSGITLASVLWKNYFGLVRDHFGECTVEELLLASQGSLWWVRCGRATLGYSGITLVSVLWKSYFWRVRDHFGECAVEELLWASQGSLWCVCVLWKSYFGLLRDHFGECGVEELFWAAGITLVSALWKSYFGLVAVEGLLWAS